jgi:glycosyltransferase involved in cell wall biosynthesis
VVVEIMMSGKSIGFVVATLVRGKMGGTEVFADELLPRISDQLDSSKIRIVQYLAKTEKPFPIDSEIIRLNTISQSTSALSRMMNYVVLRFLSRKKPNESIAFYPFTASIPPARKHTKTVILIHDIQHREIPGNFSFFQKFYRRLTYENPAKKADAVVVISNSTKSSIERFLGIPPERITIIYPGIDHTFFTLHTNQQLSRPTESFLYYPARGLAHKNHATLFNAVEQVREFFPNLKLVLSGADQDFLGKLPDFVIHEGHVTRERVRELYWGATAVVFPSLFEGFGFPPLEAMASGCPVVVSSAGSLPEVCGNAAIIVDPSSPESIAEGIKNALTKPERLIEKGLEQSKKFDWDVSARKYVDLFSNLSSR